MTPKRIKSKGKSKPAVVIKKDAREEIGVLNAKKLKSDMTRAYEAMKKAGIDGNSGDAGFRLNLGELNNFVEKAKKDNLTNAQALARFKKQYNL